MDMVRSMYIIEIIQEEGLVEKARRTGDLFVSALEGIKGITNVRGKGLMIAFDLTTTPERDKLKSILQEEMLVLTCGTKSIRLRPALTFETDEVYVACQMIEDAIDKLKGGVE